MDAIRVVEAGQLKKDREGFVPGDTVRVQVKVVEGEKERIQVFAGVVWFQVVGCGRVGPAPRPNFNLSLRMYQALKALDGMICQSSFPLKSCSVVRSKTPVPPAVIRSIWSWP